MPNHSVEVPVEQVQGLPLGAVVRVEVVGRLKGVHQIEEGGACMSLEGEAQVRPTNLRDGMEAAITNARILYPDFQTGRSEMHSP